MHRAEVVRQGDNYEEEWDGLPEAVRTKLKGGQAGEGNAGETDSFLEPPSPNRTDKEKWEEAAATATAPPTQELGAKLVGLVCGDTEGYTANGVVRRVLNIADKAEEMPSVFAKMLLKAPAKGCVGREHLSPETMRRLRRLETESKAAADKQ